MNQQPQLNQNNIQNVQTTPIQQQPQQQNPQIISPRNIQPHQHQTNIATKIASTTTINTAPPLPTSTFLSQHLTNIESKSIQLQKLNKDIYQLLKLTTPTTTQDSDVDNNYNNNNNNNINSIEYLKNINLLNQYKTKVQELIKELQNDLVNQNINLYFLTPILNDQQDTLFYEPIQQQQQQPPQETTAVSQDGSLGEAAIQQEQPLLQPEQHNIKLFNEKFQQQLTVETIQKQLQDWDSVSKDRDKLNKNAERVKYTLFDQ